MKLLTKENRRQLPPIYSQGGKDMEAIAYVKFFHPTSRWTLFVTEFDGDDQLFGYILSALGPDCDGLGYASLKELSELRAGPFNLGIERDLHFTPGPLSEVIGS